LLHHFSTDDNIDFIMAEQAAGSQTPRLPPVSTPIKQLHTQLSLTRTRHLPAPRTQRRLEPSAK